MTDSIPNGAGGLAPASAPVLAPYHALVTGGARGIGLASVRALLNAGARVTLAGRDQGALEAAQAALTHDFAGAFAGKVGITSIDVTDPASVSAGFDRARALFGPLSILVNNAGQAHSAPFVKTDAQMWQRMLDVNLNGTFHCTQAALPDMLAAKWGRVVNVASSAALTGYPYVAAYCAAKHGVLGLTRALALELAQKGITVNAVCPGFTDTDIVRESLARIVAKTGRTEQEARAELTRHNPQGRLVLPEEVADAVLWLCRPAAASMTGQAIAVAGGEV